ncbi:hypothetical protein V2J09_007658 [Rumex salicifolius]
MQNHLLILVFSNQRAMKRKGRKPYNNRKRCKTEEYGELTNAPPPPLELPVDYSGGTAMEKNILWCLCHEVWRDAYNAGARCSDSFFMEISKRLWRVGINRTWVQCMNSVRILEIRMLENKFIPERVDAAIMEAILGISNPPLPQSQLTSADAYLVRPSSPPPQDDHEDNDNDDDNNDD